jgi:hypothetical protein
MKVIASISVSNLENCVEGSDQAKQQDMQYMHAKLNIAEVQSKIEPEKEKLNELITPEFLMKILSFSKDGTEQTLKTIFKVIND